MRNDDPLYVRQLEAARDAAEIEIKALEDELKRCHEIMAEQQNDLNPTHMGEPRIDEDGNRWRWITRAGRTRELRIPATEGKKSIDAAIDGARFKQAQRDAENVKRNSKQCTERFKVPIASLSRLTLGKD